MGKKLRQTGSEKPLVSDPEMLRSVSRHVAIAALKLSEDQFDRLLKAGVLRKAESRGVYDLCGLIEDRLKLAEDENGGDGGDVTLSEAKRRFWAAKAVSEEANAEEALDRLVPLDAVLELEREAWASLVTRTDAVASRRAAKYAGMSNAADIRLDLLRELRAARGEAARLLEDRSRALAGRIDDRGDAEAAPAEDGGGVDAG